jgi:hypothetical protein
MCTYCNIEKPISHYYNCKKYGKKKKCISCWKRAKHQYRLKNRDEISLKRSEYNKNRYNNDINWKLAANLRSRLVKTIKYGSHIKDLGCTVDYLKNHLGSLFKPGMTWENYGKWHIDHIIPLSSFDLTDKNQFKKAVNYKNLQPLWAKENMSKGSRVFK